MEMDMSQYLQVFIEECKDGLQSLNDSLLALEENPEDREMVNVIFRVAHTFKGMSGSMGFTSMQQLTHQAESVLDEIRSGRLHVNSDIMDVLFRCLDALETYVENIINTGDEGVETYTKLLKELEALLGGDGGIEIVEKGHTESSTTKSNRGSLPSEVLSVKDAAIGAGQNVFDIEIHISKNCILKSARAYIIFRELEDSGEILYSDPETRDIEDEKFDTMFRVVLITPKSCDDMQKLLTNISEVEKVDIEQLTVGSESSERLVEEKPTTVEVGDANYEEPETKESESTDAGTKDTVSKQPSASKTVRVNIDRLDTLMNLVSELIIIKTQLEGVNTNISDSAYNESIEYLERITSSLHDAVMKVRMVPIESVFNRFPRMIRDVARKLGKDIDLVISGKETELDRTVIDEIGDPLIHLLRNAADHGLETIEERKRIGKDSKGTISLSAYQDGNSVVLEVSDDGKGINPAVIKEKAIEKGVITRDNADALSDKEIVELVMQPGFSTASEVSDLSGRGVGLDVVKSKIAALGGDVEIKSELGKGSNFIVRLPLTLAIIQSLMVNVGEERYAIPLSNIQSIEDIDINEFKFVQNQEVVVMRGDIIPIVRLSKVLDIETTDAESVIVVVVKKGERQVGFTVDSLIGQQEIVIKPIGKYLSGIKMIAGATILGNGEVALILDINTLV